MWKKPHQSWLPIKISCFAGNICDQISPVGPCSSGNCLSFLPEKASCFGFCLVPQESLWEENNGLFRNRVVVVGLFLGGGQVPVFGG